MKRVCSVGFTLIELLVVMVILAVLLTIAAPRYFNHVDKARENTLKQSLATMRDAIDKFHADRNQFPESLEDLVAQGYLKAVPKDPITDQRDSWQTEAAPDGDEGVFDVRSGAEGNAADGTPFGDL